MSTFENVSRLSTHLRESMGDDLRVVGVYRDGSNEIVYRRDDTGMGSDTAELTALFGCAREIHDCLAKFGESHTSLGGIKMSLHRYDRATVLQFMLAPEEGVLVSIEPNAFGSLESFAAECRTVLGGRQSRG